MTDLWSVWWVWMAAALALAIIEVLAPGFIFLGFAIGAAVTGLLLLILPGLGWTIPILALVFATLSLAAWLILRRSFALRTGQVKHFEDDING